LFLLSSVHYRTPLYHYRTLREKKNYLTVAIGMACCALILLYVQHELSYDDFHSKGDRIYRVLRETRGEDGHVTFRAGISGPFAPALMNDFPEVENAVRLMESNQVWTRYEGERLFHERRRWLLVEPDFFTVFDFTFVQGDPATALRDPGSMVISEATAKQYFGSENPIGKVITIEHWFGHHELVVAGVVRVPKNTNLRFDMVATASLLNQNEWVKERWGTWDANNHVRVFGAYILLREGADLKALKSKLPDFMARYMGNETQKNNTYHLQPLKRIHLYTHADYEGEMKGRNTYYNYTDIQNVYLFSGIACLILLIACVNFMNLATARSTNRAKEVGMRKVSGAHRFQIIRQFLGEAVLLSFLAFVLAVGVVELTLPKFSAFVGKDLAPQRHIAHLILAPGLVALIGLLAGCYPAFFLSAFEPVSVLKGHVKTGLRGTVIRKGLVVFQFAMSILLIIGTVMVYRQLNYMQHKKLGYNKELMIELRIFTESNWSSKEKAERYETLKQAFLTHPGILKATAYRLDMGTRGGVFPRALWTENGGAYQLLEQRCDEDFLSTFEIDLIAGRDFRREDNVLQGVNETGILINESAVRLLGWKNPIGKQLFTMGPSRNYTSSFTVIGVVRDFHSESLHKEIRPLFLLHRSNLFATLGLKIRGENIPETLAFMEKTWKQFVPEKPFGFSFVDDSLNQLYREEMRVGQLVGTFALLAILVACLGLFGLAAFTAEQRTKEIGVRKVLGASTRSIILLLSKEFAYLVLIANVIAWPVAYFSMGDWLQSFAYRVDVAWWVFALAGVTTLFIALGTVGYQALRAALSNPIEALRYE
jgi:putative ABC transport system permease protein